MAPDLSPLADPDAARKIGAGLRERLGETVDSVGKALVAIAGAGIFFFATGYFVEWQKFKRGGLPPDEILPLISQARIAAAGVRELAISAFFGALVIAVLGWGGVHIARWATRAPEGSSRFRRLLGKEFAQEAVVPSVVFGGLILLFVPLGWAGLIATVVLTLLLYYSLRLIATYLRAAAEDDGASFPLWRLLIAAAVAAVVLSGARQREFPEVRPHALVIRPGAAGKGVLHLPGREVDLRPPLRRRIRLHPARVSRRRFPHRDLIVVLRGGGAGGSPRRCRGSTGGRPPRSAL